MNREEQIEQVKKILREKIWTTTRDELAQEIVALFTPQEQGKLRTTDYNSGYDDAREQILGEGRPKIICLCGSTRFGESFIKAFLDLTLEGVIVLTVGNDWRDKRQWQEIDPQKKIMLDELHKRKIDLADEILVLNVGGYMGYSTMEEVKYAAEHHKDITFLEPLTVAKQIEIKSLYDMGGTL